MLFIFLIYFYFLKNNKMKVYILFKMEKKEKNYITNFPEKNVLFVCLFIFLI